MERTMSVEDKIKRAEEIYAKRQEGIQRKTATVSLNNDDNKKDIKLLKKMVIQIILSLLIYGIIYIIQNNNYIFSEEFLKKADEILSYDMNFSQMYQDIKSNIEKETLNIKNNLQKNDNQQGITNLENNAQNETEQGAIGGANEQEASTTDANSNQNNIEENNSQENTQELSQEEKDINNIKATTTFIKPIEGTISSKYGQREPTTATVPKNHRSRYCSKYGNKNKISNIRRSSNSVRRRRLRKTLKNSNRRCKHNLCTL